MSFIPVSYTHLNEIIEAGRNDEYDQLYRVNKLILLLSYTNSDVSLSRLEDALYISRSQLYADLKILDVYKRQKSHRA